MVAIVTVQRVGNFIVYTHNFQFTEITRSVNSLSNCDLSSFLDFQVLISILIFL